MIAVAATFLVFAGALILVAALFVVRRLMAQLPQGTLRSRWHFLSALILLFLVGYVGYLIAFSGSLSRPIDLLVPGIFFLGACFVWLTANLSLKTARDVMRVSTLERESLTDHLTRLVNRRYLERRMSEEIATARRYSRPLSIVLIDIDLFKEINDAHGHPAGDQVLVMLGEIAGGELRESDVLARYGGDEFVIIAPQTDLKHAVDLAERLRKRIESHEFILRGGAIERRTIRLTASLGVAAWGGANDTADALVSSADRGLYLAKQEGRNRVCVSSHGA